MKQKKDDLPPHLPGQQCHQQALMSTFEKCLHDIHTSQPFHFHFFVDSRLPKSDVLAWHLESDLPHDPSTPITSKLPPQQLGQ